MNSFGRYLRLTTFGESHGPAVGGVIDGMPPRIPIDHDAITEMMAARRPGSGINVSARDEADKVEILSGVSPDGVTLGTPLAFIIRNTDARSSDYEEMRHIYRPNHADFTYQMKYGIRDHRGGGRASARETAARVAAAAIVLPILHRSHISVTASLESIGGCADASQWDGILSHVRDQSDSIGGTVKCKIAGMPAGIGEPVFGKLQATLAAAMMSIPGAKGFEYGLGFEAAARRGSQVLDSFCSDSLGNIRTTANFSGGIQGGISNGMDIDMRIAFKPTPTIDREVATVNDRGESVTLKAAGRHDPCIAVRGVAVVKAMAILTVADYLCH